MSEGAQGRSRRAASLLSYLPTARALSGETGLLDAVSADPNRAILGLWQSPQSLVAPHGFSRKKGIEAACAASATRGWPVSFRCTGGDVTPQGAGIANATLCYALEPGKAPNIADTFDTLCAPVFQLFGGQAGYGYVDGAFCDGAYNITLSGLKFAGTAQRFRRSKSVPSRIAVMSHAIFVLSPPQAEVFEALNQFLSDLGEPRVIRRAQHVGLPAGVTSDGFFKALIDGYTAQFAHLEHAADVRKN